MKKEDNENSIKLKQLQLPFLAQNVGERDFTILRHDEIFTEIQYLIAKKHLKFHGKDGGDIEESLCIQEIGIFLFRVASLPFAHSNIFAPEITITYQHSVGKEIRCMGFCENNWWSEKWKKNEKK